MTTLALPDGAYYGWRYIDARRRIDRRQLYFEDGRIEMTQGDETTTLCTLSAEQVAAAREAVDSADLRAAAVAEANDAHDTATVVYAWHTAAGAGVLSNANYPAVEIEAIRALDEKLAAIEEEAGCWPLMADEEAAAEYAAMDD